MLLACFSLVLQEYLPYSLNTFEVYSFIKKYIDLYLVLAMFLPKMVEANEQCRILLNLELLIWAYIRKPALK